MSTEITINQLLTENTKLMDRIVEIEDLPKPVDKSLYLEAEEALNKVLANSREYRHLRYGGCR